MPGKRVSKTEYGKLSLACTALFIVLAVVYWNATHASPNPLIPEVWFYSFCILGFLSAVVLAVVAGFYESRWWWLAMLPAGGCAYLTAVYLVFVMAFPTSGPRINP